MGSGAAARTPPPGLAGRVGPTCTHGPPPPTPMAKPNANARPEPKVEEVAAVWCDLKDLKPWDRNPRRNDKAIAKVAASMKRFGWGAPILARTADREIIAGHTRILAAESLGMTRVPVRFLDLDPADAHLLALADNKLNEIAEWDTAAVANILSEYGLEDAALAGWDAAELDKMAAEIAGDDAADDLSSESMLGGSTFLVQITCENESHQAEVYEQLSGMGFKTKLVSL